MSVNPSRQPTAYKLNAGERQEILQVAERISALREKFAADVARELSENDLWADEYEPANESDPRRFDVSAHQRQAARFKACVVDLTDDFMNQHKIAEAGEVT